MPAQLAAHDETSRSLFYPQGLSASPFQCRVHPHSMLMTSAPRCAVRSRSFIMPAERVFTLRCESSAFFLSVSIASMSITQLVKTFSMARGLMDRRRSIPSLEDSIHIDRRLEYQSRNSTATRIFSILPKEAWINMKAPHDRYDFSSITIQPI